MRPKKKTASYQKFSLGHKHSIGSTDIEANDLLKAVMRRFLNNLKYRDPNSSLPYNKIIQIVNNIFKAAGWGHMLYLAKIRELWFEKVDPFMAQHAYPRNVSFTHGVGNKREIVLHLAVYDGGFIQTIYFEMERYLNMLNKLSSHFHIDRIECHLDNLGQISNDQQWTGLLASEWESLVGAEIGLLCMPAFIYRMSRSSAHLMVYVTDHTTLQQLVASPEAGQPILLRLYHHYPELRQVIQEVYLIVRQGVDLEQTRVNAMIFAEFPKNLRMNSPSLEDSLLPHGQEREQAERDLQANPLVTDHIQQLKSVILESYETHQVAASPSKTVQVSKVDADVPIEEIEHKIQEIIKQLQQK